MQEQYHPSGGSRLLIVTNSFFMVFAFIFVSLRVYVRSCIVKALGSEDWTAVLSLILFLTCCGLSIVGAFNGSGQHMVAIGSFETYSRGLMWWWISSQIYIASNMIVKLSIGLLLLKFLFERWHRLAVYITLSLLQVWSIVLILMLFLQCKPVSYIWKRILPNSVGVCSTVWLSVYGLYVHTAIVLAVDICFAFLPWLMVKDVQMNPRSKLLVSVVLGMGSIACAITIARVPYIASANSKTEFLYDTIDLAILSNAETGIAIAASSGATLKPLFKSFIDRGQSLKSPMAANRGIRWQGGTNLAYVRHTSRLDGVDVETEAEQGRKVSIPLKVYFKHQEPRT